MTRKRNLIIIKKKYGSNGIKETSNGIKGFLPAGFNTSIAASRNLNNRNSVTRIIIQGVNRRMSLVIEYWRHSFQKILYKSKHHTKKMLKLRTRVLLISLGIPGLGVPYYNFLSLIIVLWYRDLIIVPGDWASLEFF